MKNFLKHSTIICLIALTVAACESNKSSDTLGSNSPEAKVASDTSTNNSAETALTVTDKGCEPNQLTVSSGQNSFVLTNKSSQPLEWEILSGVKVIEERENIAPGFVQKLKTNLEPGEYDMACGLRSNPKGKITVKAGVGDSQAKGTVDRGKLVGAIAEYKVYVTKEVDQLVADNKTFTDAVIAGDLPKAQKLYASTHVHWERAEPIAELFSDLDKTMDSRADDFAKKEADPQFTGYHRLEKALFQDKTTKGMKPFAEKLQKDGLELQKRIATLTIEPKNMVGGAAGLIEEVAATKISGEEDRYSHTDLWDFSANVDGSQKIVELLRPVIQKANPDLLARVDANFTKVNQGLAKYKTPDGGFATYDKVSDADKKDMKTAIAALSEDLSQLRGTLGVN
ncbi:iron uptake system protein EfeO [Nostoc sp. 'Peltigera membranacea cyanobiont' 232]|uniref:iron uptake system protein EfeO n=1 Tax=Nostoc sp. 'Peltigera membranacea cyanobiont' 232 TaxID=2014531 RepID=UPI000B9578CC|nr:iron uptake system protein EfeO [Nostoc sp. 'Peltigera membranacea cyanobiont' 232]OYE03109.1 ferrous iron transporter [Nostoc sp. 'Peltigera membranacea cyanobiont' 232]